GRFAGAGVSLRLHVRAENLVEVPRSGEPTGAAHDLGLSKCKTAALGPDRDLGLLAVVAGDSAAAAGRLVEGRPAFEVERHLAMDEAAARIFLIAGRDEAGGSAAGPEKGAEEKRGSDCFGLHHILRARCGRPREPL